MYTAGEIPLRGCFLVSPCTEYTKKEVRIETVVCINLFRRQACPSGRALDLQISGGQYWFKSSLLPPDGFVLVVPELNSSML